MMHEACMCDYCKDKISVNVVVDTIDVWKERIKSRISMNETTSKEHTCEWTRELCANRAAAYKVALADFEELVG